MLAIRQISFRYFSILDRYLWREFGLYLLAVTSVLWLIFVATRFARYLAQAAVGNLPSDVIFSLLGYSSLGTLSLLLPLGTFLAVMLALGRMNADNELTVMATCGVSNYRLNRSVLIFSGIIAIFIGLLVFIWAPQALLARHEIAAHAELSADTSGLVAGTFKESHSGDWTFYLQNVADDKKTMEGIFIEIHRDGRRPLIFRAARGWFDIEPETRNKYLILEDGYRYEGQAGDKDFTIAKYERHSLLIEKGEEEEYIAARSALPTSILWQRRHSSYYMAEIQWRASSVIMTIILSLIAINLVKAAPRQGRYAGFFPAILIYIVYSNLLGITRAWVSKGIVSPWFGAVWVHILMILILVIMFNWSKIRIYRIRKQAVGLSQ
jgi:lipopolysaccharide export system permease protein